MSDHIGEEQPHAVVRVVRDDRPPDAARIAVTPATAVPAEATTRDLRHPYADHPAALVLADHQPRYVTASTKPAAPVRCDSDECDWEGQWCDFAAHQTAKLDRAGLLKEDE